MLVSAASLSIISVIIRLESTQASTGKLVRRKMPVLQSTLLSREFWEGIAS